MLEKKGGLTMKVKFDVMVGKEWQNRKGSDFVFILLPFLGVETERLWCPKGRVYTIEFAWLFFDVVFEFSL